MAALTDYDAAIARLRDQPRDQALRSIEHHLRDLAAYADELAARVIKPPADVARDVAKLARYATELVVNMRVMLNNEDDDHADARRTG